jgi:protein required for attachment to host cells
MPRIIIVVADAVRARFYTFEPEENLDGTYGGHVVEQSVLVNPERRLKSELFTESRPPLGHSSPTFAAGGQRFAVDDHRDAHIRAIDQRFANDIVKMLDTQLDQHPAPRAIVAAGPHMLGLVRQALREVRHHDVAIDDLALDLTRETPSRLHDHLARMAFVPPRIRYMRALR